jgi:hypothetical protein
MNALFAKYRKALQLAALRRHGSVTQAGTACVVQTTARRMKARVFLVGAPILPGSLRGTVNRLHHRGWPEIDVADLNGYLFDVNRKVCGAIDYQTGHVTLHLHKEWTARYNFTYWGSRE